MHGMKNLKMTKLIVASRNFDSASKNCSHGNVGDILRSRSMFEEKLGDLQACAFRFPSKIKEIKTPFLISSCILKSN